MQEREREIRIGLRHFWGLGWCRDWRTSWKNEILSCVETLLHFDMLVSRVEAWNFIRTWKLKIFFWNYFQTFLSKNQIKRISWHNLILHLLKAPPPTLHSLKPPSSLNDMNLCYFSSFFSIKLSSFPKPRQKELQENEYHFERFFISLLFSWQSWKEFNFLRGVPFSSLPVLPLPRLFVLWIGCLPF